MEIKKVKNEILDEISEVFSKVNDEEIEILVKAISDASRVFMVGRGRSGNVMKNFGMRLMHLGLETYIVGETTTPGIRNGDLLIIGSGSGNTESLVSYANRAKILGAKVALLTINPYSEISKCADLVLRIPAYSPKIENSTSKSIQPMANLFEQVLGLTGAVVVMSLMEKMNKTSGQMLLNHANLE
ncbi:MAG: 6-phospho-3-hexuloisomerase [Kosmotogales bacterium]|nr:6-phospho-3-hexuloisomerase [Kosmotogales bacterium]